MERAKGAEKKVSAGLAILWRMGAALFRSRLVRAASPTSRMPARSTRIEPDVIDHDELGYEVPARG